MEIFTIFHASWLLTSTLVLSMLCIFLYTNFRSINWLSMVVPKLPPNPPKLPIIGNLLQLLGKPRHEALWHLSNKYGPIMQIYIGSKPFLVISSSTMAKQILKTQDHIFCTRPMTQASKRISYNYLDIAFSPHSRHWREMRKLFVSELIGLKRTNLFNHALVTKMEVVIGSLSSVHPSNEEVNLSELFFDIVKGVVCKMVFGNNFKEEPLKNMSLEVVIDETLDLLSGSLGDSFPWLGPFMDRFSGWNGRLEKCFSTLDALIEMVVEKHQNYTSAEIRDDDKDFVHTLVELSMNENASGYRLTKDDVKALVMDLITGGIDTTVVTMVWAMSEIIRSARVMQKLQSEIRRCAGIKQKIDEFSITKMTYLKMVVKETLRLHPPAPLLIPHESLSHTQIDGYDVFPGTTVLINGWVIGRDPSTWGENAGEFYPERFENLVVDFEMVPFGGGRRSCPAMNTAPVTIQIVLANLLYGFNWEVPVGVKREDLDMQEVGSLVVRKKIPLCLVPTKHNSED